jgi:hypothetical protein
MGIPAPELGFRCSVDMYSPIYHECPGVPRNAVLSVGYLWGQVRDADLWDFCGARGRPRWLSQLGVKALGALLQGGLAAKASELAVARPVEL